MVYIRNKKVKGIDYAYLVQSVWDTKRNMSRQQTIKYLGKASQITIEDIPEEYRDDTKIQAFVAAFSSYQEERKTLVLKIQEEMFALLIDCNVIALVGIYEKYSRLFGLTEFYDKLLKPVMYRIGDLWQQGQLDVATEHAGTNTAISLIKIINERLTVRTTDPETSSEYKAVILLLIGMLALSCLSATSSIFRQQDQALAQKYIQTVKYRNLVIDLGNGVKARSQLTYPAVGKGPFPGVLLIPGTGAIDMNATLAKNARPFWQIAQYLSERGFAVLRYDKRGVGANLTILDTNVWGNLTANQLKQDAEKALNVLMQQPEVDPKRITLIGHSEGTVIAPRVAIDNPTNVKNIMLMGTVAQNLIRDLLRYQVVDLPSEYATQVLDKNHTGLISIQQIAKDPLLGHYLVPPSLLDTNNTKVITNNLVEKFGSTSHVSIQKQIRPELIKYYEMSQHLICPNVTRLEVVLYGLDLNQV
jgi:alpha/beta hydrolase fold/B12 binding domain